jgi:hypothetical protein
LIKQRKYLSLYQLLTNEKPSQQNELIQNSSYKAMNNVEDSAFKPLNNSEDSLFKTTNNTEDVKLSNEDIVEEK